MMRCSKENIAVMQQRRCGNAALTRAGDERSFHTTGFFRARRFGVAEGASPTSRFLRK